MDEINSKLYTVGEKKNSKLKIGQERVENMKKK